MLIAVKDAQTLTPMPVYWAALFLHQLPGRSRNLLAFSSSCSFFSNAQLNLDRFESTLSVPAMQGCMKNALTKSFGKSPHMLE